MAKATVKLATKKCNLFCYIDANRLEKRCYAFYCPRMKHVLLQIRSLQVAWIPTSDWIKLRGSHAIYGSFVTCCKTSLSLAVNRPSCTEFAATLYFRNLQQAGLLQDRFDSSVIECITLLFNSFCSNDGEQVTSFRCPFYRTLKVALVVHYLLTTTNHPTLTHSTKPQNWKKKSINYI